MHGSTVPCPILWMCLLNFVIVNVWIGVVIYHKRWRSCLFYEIGEEEGEPLVWRRWVGRTCWAPKYIWRDTMRVVLSDVCYSVLVISFSTFFPSSMIASSSFIQQTFLTIYSLLTKLKSPDKPANLN